MHPNRTLNMLLQHRPETAQAQLMRTQNAENLAQNIAVGLVESQQPLHNLSANPNACNQAKFKAMQTEYTRLNGIFYQMAQGNGLIKLDDLNNLANQLQEQLHTFALALNNQ